MLWLSLVVCLSTLWQASILSPVNASKPKPVDLEYSCLKLKSNVGYPDDVPIILIHGMSSYKEVWGDVNEVLASETPRKVCIVDLRNHGDSPWSDVVDTVAMAEDIIHLLDKLKIPKAALLGHSLGGKIAVEAALSYPEKVEKLIVEDMRPNSFSPEVSQQMDLFLNLMKGVQDLIPQGIDSEMEAREIFLKNFNDYLAKRNSTVFYDDPHIFPIKCSNGKCRWNTNLVFFDKLREDIDAVMPESSGRFDGPALFIYGAESHFKVNEDESNIKKLFPNAKLVGVKESGHMVHKFPEFMKEVVKFLNEKSKIEF